MLGEVLDGPVIRLRCRTGHAVTPETLAEEKAAAVADALWAAVRALEKKAALAWRLSERDKRRGDSEGASRHRREAHAAERRAAIVREVLGAVEGDDGQHPQVS